MVMFDFQSLNMGGPQVIIHCNGIFRYKPSIVGVPPCSGNLQIAELLRSQVFDDPGGLM